MAFNTLESVNEAIPSYIINKRRKRIVFGWRTTTDFRGPQPQVLYLFENEKE